MRLVLTACLALLLIGCGSKPAPAPAAQQQPPDNTLTYGRDIQPLFATNCASCHAAGGAAAKYDLTTYQGVTALVVPGQPDSSKLYQMLVEGKMPPTGKLDSMSLAKVRDWIAQGAREK